MKDRRIHIVDSHTGGEPTRIVIEGGPPLGNGSMAHRLALFRDDFDHYRSAVVNEPRGYDAIVGALLCEPVDSTCSAGVIFFNNAGYLGMCGHGNDWAYGDTGPSWPNWTWSTQDRNAGRSGGS